MSAFELVVMHEGSTVRRVALSQTPCRIGRAPANELVVSDESVSGYHAQVWVEAGRVWLQDLTSRNGTFVNDKRVRGSTPVTDADRIRVGQTVLLQISGTGAAPTMRFLQLEDVVSGVRLPIRSSPFPVPGPSGGEDSGAVILMLPDGELRLGREHDDRALALDEVFEVGERTWRVVEAVLDHTPTLEFHQVKFPYVAEASDGPSGFQVLLKDEQKGTSQLLTGNRGLLMYLLARQLSEDRASGHEIDAEGWCNDMEVASAIWGRGVKDANNLHVLIHRLRKSVKGAGFDPWFVEKRQWGVRLRLRHVDVK